MCTKFSMIWRASTAIRGSRDSAGIEALPILHIILHNCICFCFGAGFGAPLAAGFEMGFGHHTQSHPLQMTLKCIAPHTQTNKQW